MADLEEYEMVDNPQVINNTRRSDTNPYAANIPDNFNPFDNDLFSSNGYNFKQRRREEDESDSETSLIFERLHISHDEDNFTNKETFINILNYYNTKAPSSKKMSYFLIFLGLLIWVGALVVYSQMKITDSSTWKWQTSLIQLGNENITINAYDVHRRNLTMDSIRHGKLSIGFRYVYWLNKQQYPSGGGPGYYLTLGPQLSYILINSHTESQEMFIKQAQFSYENNFFYIEDIILNPAKPIDDAKVYHIVKTDSLKQWRHSSFGLFWLYRPIFGTYIPIQPVMPGQETLKPKVLRKLHFAQFSPNGEKVLFGVDHDLYVLDINSLDVHRVTDSGSSEIFNGKPDWIYEEEVLSSDQFFWWSPDSQHVVFGQINDTQVMDYEIDYYVKDPNDVGLTYELSKSSRVNEINQYPIKKSLKYPKPGSKDPEVTIYDFSLISKQSKKLNCKLEKESIVYGGGWINKDYFHIKITDRRSKIMSKQVININDNSFTEIDKKDSEDFDGWFDKVSSILPVHNGYIDKIFVHGRSHLAYYENPLSTEPKLLSSSSEWDILEKAQVVYNEVEDVIYTLSNVNGSMDAHLIGISLSGDLKFILGGRQSGYFDFNSDDRGQFICLEYLGPELSWQKIINTADLHLHEESPDLINQYLDAVPYLNDLRKFQTQLSQYNLPTRRYHTVKLKDVSINMIEILPPNFNPNKKKKYPILVNVYGGPGSQTVTKEYNIGFNDVVSAVLDTIVLIIEPRGTNGQGWKYKSFAKNNIGFWEGRDIKTITSEYINKNKGIINKENVAIWGWSYGGFSTLKTLELDQGSVFKYGMAVAPVTNWLFYNSFYTERYMNLPTETDYISASINDIKALDGVKRFLIMHGTADDNVHLQNLLWLIDRLNINGTENYDIHIFTDNNHAINYHNGGIVVYDKLLRWLADAFIGKF